jgi:uncharacterized protein (DUF362 family)
MSTNSCVVITHAPENNYMTDYVVLPKSYGTKEFNDRKDIRDIRETVFKNLNDLDAKTNFTNNVKGRKVLIKPNLVSVFYKFGFKDDEYPESTDPRVLDAVVQFVKQYTDDITIIESSGRGMPTMTSFKVAGIDRMAKLYGTKLVALEEEPVERYILPKAQIMKEMLVPKVLTQVIDGEAFYISVPKMKTNLYTGVTLGFKNAMGSIPYNLRQRNHNYDINKKLVDILYCYKPDLVVIDGIIGGEGNTPAPVDPVQTHVIISGNNSVETDRVATRMMGIDPESIELITEATKQGFGDTSVEIIGQQKVIPFRKADQTLLSDFFKSQFPNVKYLVGHTVNKAPAVSDPNKVSPADVVAIEKACVGGCLAALRQGFDMFYYQGLDNNFEMVAILGTGSDVNGVKYYFDRDGKPYTKEDIASLPGKKLAFGSCTRDLTNIVDLFVDGCMPLPTASLKAVHKLSKQANRLYSLKNKQLFALGIAALKMRAKRINFVKNGIWVDCVPSYFTDEIHKVPELSEEDMKKDYIHWPLPKLGGEDQSKLMNDVKKNSF